MSESWRPGDSSFTEDNGFGIGGPPGLSGFADGEIRRLQFIQPRHEGSEIIGLDARRPIGAGVVAHHEAGGLQGAPMGPGVALGAAQIIGDQAGAGPNGRHVLFQPVLVEVLDIEQQGHPLLHGEHRRALQHRRGDPRHGDAGLPAPGAGLRADCVKVGGALGEAWSPVVAG